MEILSRLYGELEGCPSGEEGVASEAACTFLLDNSDHFVH
jgi:hypothetical protein